MNEEVSVKAPILEVSIIHLYTCIMIYLIILPNETYKYSGQYIQFKNKI